MTSSKRGGRPAILLDRDGTIIVDAGYLASPDGVVLEDGAINGLRRLADAGYTLAVVSNQSGIGRGYFPEDAAHAVNAQVDALLADGGVAIAGWYICPHAPDTDCDCRKPAPGMALQAARELDLDLARSWVIGDKPSDLQLGDAVGARSILVTTGEGARYREWAAEHGRHICDTLDAAAMVIVAADMLTHATAASPVNG